METQDIIKHIEARIKELDEATPLCNGDLDRLEYVSRSAELSKLLVHILTLERK